MSLLPEYHATLSCRQSAENVNRTLASMSLSVSGTAYARRNSVQSASRFIFARHIPYSFSMLRRHIPLPTFLPTADMTVIPGAERTEVRLLFQPEDTTLLLMVMLYSALLAMELILIPIVFLTQASLLHYFSLLLFPIALFPPLSAEARCYRSTP